MKIFVAGIVTETNTPAPAPKGMGAFEELGIREAYAAHLAVCRMVDNAAELAMRLQALSGAPGYIVRWFCPSDEDHMTVPFAAFRPALGLAFPPQE